MTRIPSVALAVTWLAIGAAACGSGKRPMAEPAPAEPAVTSPPAAPDPAPAAAPELEPSAEQLPLEEDFAPQVEQEITEKNYRAALDALAKEIAADGVTK